MADIEKPINDYDFSKGEKPKISRLEEEYMYKYLAKRPKKEKPNEDDSDISAFAEQEIMNKMKQLNGLSGPDNMSDDDLELSEGDFTDDGPQEGEEDAEMDQEGDELSEEGSDGFFGEQDDLESVNFNEEEGEDYGEEYDEEVEEQERAQEEKQGKKDKKKDKKEKDSGFASYEDFAHLLDEGAEEQVTQKKFTKKRDNKFKRKGGK